MFKGRHFDRSVILLCVRWYVAYNLSLRNLEEMMAERGISVDHATVQRWIVRFARIAGAVQAVQASRHWQVARRRDICQGARALDVSLPGHRQPWRHGRLQRSRSAVVDDGGGLLATNLKSTIKHRVGTQIEVPSSLPCPADIRARLFPVWNICFGSQ